MGNLIGSHLQNWMILHLLFIILKGKLQKKQLMIQIYLYYQKAQFY